MKNKITIYNGCYENKKKIELFDFTKVDHINIDGKHYLRVLCGNKYYYYLSVETSIGEIEIYDVH